jgi:hypothetical protein
VKSEIGKQICRPKNVHKVILKRAKMEYLEKVRIASIKIHSKNCALSEFWNFLPQNFFSFISFFLCSAYSFTSCAHMKNTKKNYIFAVRENFLNLWNCSRKLSFEDSNMQLEVLYRTIFDGYSRNIPTKIQFCEIKLLCMLAVKKLWGFSTKVSSEAIFYFECLLLKSFKKINPESA